MRRTHLLGPALIASAVLVLTAGGCTAKKASETSVEVGDGTPVSAQFLADTGAKSCTDVTSGHLEVSMGGSAQAQASSMQMSGDFDTSTKQSSFTIDGSPLGGQGQIVTDGDTAYVSIPSLTKLTGASTPWVALSGDAGAMKDLAGQVAPISGSCDVMDLLRGAGGEVTTVGPEVVGGVATTHYTATIDLTKAGGKALGRFGGSSTVPVDVWVDADGIARRVSVAYSHGTGDQGTEKASFTMNMDLSAVNEPISITVPPADQVTTLDFGSLLGGLMGTGPN